MTARFDPFAGSGPRWYAIEARRPFLEDLAAGVLDWLGELPPEALSDAVILLPNRRAARAFTGALTRLTGDRPVLLPQVRPLGDLEEDEPPFAPGELGLDLPPAIAPLTRRFEMARMIVEEFRPGLGPLRALEMADALGGFLDSSQLEEVEDPGLVATLVEDDLAEHWQESARFLGLAVEAWPRRLAAMGLVDPAWRRARLLRLLAEAWTERPPTRPVIAAGSTGTVPAAADVLAAVAGAPLGCVVLPGLDRDLDPLVWAGLGDNEQHPQNALWRLLDRHAVEREAVRPWFDPPADPAPTARGRARQRLLNEALRPADATDDWRKVITALRADAFRERSADPIAEGLEGLSVVTVRAEEDAAATLALMIRETLETPGRTCALVTPDLALGRRVAARLERWGVVADNSSGQPLSRMAAGRLVDLCARFIVRPLDPHALLGLLKHPLVQLDLDGEDPAIAIKALEAHALRGPRLRDWARARRALLKVGEPREDGRAPSDHTLARLAAAHRLLDRLEVLSEAALAPFAEDAPLDAAACALTELIEALAGQTVWAGPDGEAAASLLAGLIEGGGSLGAVSRAEFAELVSGLLGEETVRTGGANQPRLRILGAIEARLVRADRMILAGLEEGVWPNAAPTDPFLSRPMRKALGLPPPERRLGQTAQDFVQAACADEAILVHSERRGGQPAVKSRWLWRLEMLTRGAHTTETPVELERPSVHLGQARALDAPVRRTPDYAPRPEPRPPVERRPRELPVTGVERWVRDPYAIYARYVLNLRQLDRPGQSAEALARGNAVHKAIERLTLTWPAALPDDCADQLETLLLEELTQHGFEDAAMAREAPLARNCARWLTGWEAERRARGVEIRVEEKVRMTLPAPFGPFTLTAKADRIELSATGAAVLDFKTGQIPSPKQVKTGFSPQLTLTGAILAGAGLSDIGPVQPEELTYVRVVGRKIPGEAAVRAVGVEAVALSEAALDGLTRRIARFDDPATPYPSWVGPQFMGSFGGNYDHLARVWEWHVVGGEDGGEAE
ncbi:double-strand break repair protein AddB [Brevundimonas basaltis]|uniref:ATP-dependent helicase/nuclease subunit B n=1 Tax=Brevundimonas basaltis TaxID=472166 RepID=A0A7W8MGW9_9CAUL|nr:double-strand break repair protein AddB [Brevundimonas basaltis]MBB5291627.1 ATP-dependent helicase/nuclease subunit B [Brevundimonas basaltis]